MHPLASESPGPAWGAASHAPTADARAWPAGQRRRNLGGTRAGHGRWNYRVRLAEGNAAYLEWSAHSKDAMVGDGESGTDMYCEALGAAQPLQR
jgi:hypothetical protein